MTSKIYLSPGIMWNIWDKSSCSSFFNVFFVSVFLWTKLQCKMSRMVLIEHDIKWYGSALIYAKIYWEPAIRSTTRLEIFELYHYYKFRHWQHSNVFIFGKINYIRLPWCNFICSEQLILHLNLLSVPAKSLKRASRKHTWTLFLRLFCCNLWMGFDDR